MSEIDQLLEIQEDSKATREAVQELTKIIGELVEELKTLNEEWQRVKRAGRF